MEALGRSKIRGSQFNYIWKGNRERNYLVRCLFAGLAFDYFGCVVGETVVEKK